MKCILIIIAVFISNANFAQSNLKLIIGELNTISKSILSKEKYRQGYIVPSFNIGIQIENKWLTTSISGAYNFSGNIDNLSVYALRSQFIGGILNLKFLNPEKGIRPYISISGFYEVRTNYKNGILVHDSYIPQEIPLGSGIPSDRFFSPLYYSTPFVASAVLGCDFRLIENLHLNLGVGYGYRKMKTKYATWLKEESIDEVARNEPTSNIRSHMLDIQLGLSYAFPFKKSDTINSPPF
jgi:hypothetical protein